MRRFLLAAAMCVAAMSGSRAADMPDLPILRGPVGLSSTRVNWQGFYAGGQGGFSHRQKHRHRMGTKRTASREGRS